MRKKLRANDDLRTRFRPSCINKSLEVNDGIETLGVTRDGDFIVKQNRNPAISKHYRSIQRNETESIRKSRRQGCESPLFTKTFGSVCEKRADGSGECDVDFFGPFSTHFFHPFHGNAKQGTTLGSVDVGDVILDDWYHITFIRDDDFLVLYVNGEPISATLKPLGNALKNNESNGLMIGGVRVSSWSPDALFNGRIDQPCAWNRMLQPHEISELYSQGIGKEFSAWSDSLKIDSEFSIEFNSPLSVTGGSVVGEVKNLVDGTDVTVTPSVLGVDRNMLRDGKVSDFSFTPAYIDELIYPVADMQNAKLSVASSTGDAREHQVLFMPGDFATRTSYTMSAWVSPHGMSYSENTRDLLNDVNLGSFEKDGQMVQKTYGVIFSDYAGYSKHHTVDANFTVSFGGTFKNDPNASSLVAPSKTKNLTALPEAPGKVNNLTAAGSLFLIPNFNFNHAAMGANQSIIRETGVGRFKNSAGFGSNAIGLRAAKWLIELTGHGEAAIRSDDGLGGTVHASGIGQQKSPISGGGVVDGSWCLFLNTDNHEGFRPARNTFFANQHLDKQTYFLVISAHSLIGRYRWQDQTNMFEKRFPIFGTHENTKSRFGVDLTLINGMKDLSFRVMDENHALNEVIVSNFTAGTGEVIPVTLITLNVNYDSPTEPSSIFINGHKKGELPSKGKPSHILNNMYRSSTDSISIAEGPTIGSGSKAEPDHYTRMNLHEVGSLDNTSKWWNHPDHQHGPITSPNHEKGDGYLAHKWHIDHLLPDDHPFKDQPPTA